MDVKVYFPIFFSPFLIPKRVLSHTACERPGIAISISFTEPTTYNFTELGQSFISLGVKLSPYEWGLNLNESGPSQ